MRKSQTQEIEGYSYRVTQLGTREARRLLISVAKIALPSIGALAKGADLKDIKSVDLSGLSLDVVFQALANSLDADSVDRIFDTLASCTEVSGKGEYGSFGEAGTLLDRHMEEHFAGRPLAELKWAAFAFKVQLGNFSGGIAEVVAVLRQSPASASPTI